MKKLILSAMLCLALQGCVDVVVPKTRTKVISDPEVCVYRGAAEEVRIRNSSETTNQVVYKSNCTSEWLRTYWGDPEHISHISANSDEIWTYKSGLVWEGVVPFVIIPIPLVLPVAKEKVCFSLHDGHVVSVSVTKSCTVGGTYGFIPNPEGGGGWGVWSWTESWKGIP
jgi:hypothetical protein